MQLILFEAFLAVAQGTKEPRVLTALATGARAILDIAGVVTYDEQLADMRARLGTSKRAEVARMKRYRHVGDRHVDDRSQRRVTPVR